MTTLKRNSDARVAAAASELQILWKALLKDPAELYAIASATAAAAAAASAAATAAAAVAAAAATAAAAAVAAVAATAEQHVPERPSRVDGGQKARPTTRIFVGGQLGALKAKTVAPKPTRKGWGPLRKGTKLMVPGTEFGVDAKLWRGSNRTNATTFALALLFQPWRLPSPWPSHSTFHSSATTCLIYWHPSPLIYRYYEAIVVAVFPPGVCQDD